MIHEKRALERAQNLDIQIILLCFETQRQH